MKAKHIKKTFKALMTGLVAAKELHEEYARQERKLMEENDEPTPEYERAYGNMMSAELKVMQISLAMDSFGKMVRDATCSRDQRVI